LDAVDGISDPVGSLKVVDMDIGPTELIIILVIVLLLFGVGRIGKIAGELGSGIRAFKEGLSGDKDQKAARTSDSQSGAEEEIPDPGKSDPPA
jgi:sec-independent protein translocase protein TatA